MNYIRFKIKDIEENKKYRPVGYFEDVMSKGQVDGLYIKIPESEAIELVKKYYEKNPVLEFAQNKEIWGPMLWKLLHERSSEYNMDIDAEKRWLRIFTSWIPCGKCKSHFINLLEENPADLTSAKNYRKWTIMIHNLVNQSLNKPIYTEEI